MLTFVFCERNKIKKRKNARKGKGRIIFLSNCASSSRSRGPKIGEELAFVCCCFCLLLVLLMLLLFLCLLFVCLFVWVPMLHATLQKSTQRIPVEERLTETIGSPSLREFALLSIERGLGFMVVALLLLLVFLVGPFPNDGD